MKNVHYNRPDFSNYLVHFTKGEEFCREEQNDEIIQYKDYHATDRFKSILKSKCIYASKMPWTDTDGVCFTECTRNSLFAHAKKYSSYGIGFEKDFIFRKKGAPIFYLRANLFARLSKMEKNKTLNEIWAFITPFSPPYAPKYVKECLGKDGNGRTCDFTHEREWRCPVSVKFEYSDIAFIIVDKLSDIKGIPEEALDTIKDKIIVMENYALIESLWPTHIIDKEQKVNKD